MKMTVHELIEIAEANKYAEKLGTITEYADRYVVSYVSGDGEVPDVSPLYIMKDTGEVGTFFPPYFSDEYLDSGVDVPIPQEYYDNGIAIHVPDDDEDDDDGACSEAC